MPRRFDPHQRVTAPGEDILAWLDRAITMQEQVAQEAARFHGPRWVRPVDTGVVRVSDSNIWFEALSDEIAEHVVYNSPEVVLRRCAADRKLVSIHQPVEGRSGWGPDDDDTEGAYGDISCACSSCGAADDAVRYPCPTVVALAEGYGWTEGER